jgi:hypothetical protein
MRRARLHAVVRRPRLRCRVQRSDHDHFTEQWTKSENGKDTVFDLHFVRR